VNSTLRAMLADSGGLLRREDALAVLHHDVLDRAVWSGRLVQVYPRVYVDPGLASDPRTLVRAAVAYAGGMAAVSHVTGLALWRLPVPATGPVHVTTWPSRHLRGATGLVVHRREQFTLAPPEVLWRAGCPVVRLERCVVDSWPLLDGDARRAPVIQAVAQRMTTPARLRVALGAVPRLGGRRHLAKLIDLLDAGCRSELELWGYVVVFQGLGLRWQMPIRIDGRTCYLDLYDEVGRVNFELDGRKYHSGVVDRERDLRRDAALAAMGITVVRFTHDRLVREPGAVRDQAIAILASRRRLAA
jgi:very-short-patch-repair endonuclease